MDVFDYIEKELDRIEVGYTSYDGTRLTMSIDDVRELIENLRKKLAQNLPNTCISRQAAIDVVKRNTFRLTFAQERNCEGHVAWSTEAVYSDVMENELLELPSAQPEPITCNQCVYYQQNHHYCEFLDAEFSPSDFCSQAERREE